MQKNYNLVKVSVMLLLLLIQNNLQAQNRCLDCPADVKAITDKQVLLDKIEIKEGASTTLNTNLYVSYRSGNAQKFWANLAIATAGVAVSTQLQSNSSAEGNNANNISPLIPLGVSVATLPSIWKNRPRGVPQAGLWLQHRDTRGRLTDTWEQPISSEAKNSGELLSINIDKPLSAGTVEVYLQNGSKNPVYYWGYESSKMLVKSKGIILGTPPVAFGLGCPSGYLSNGNGRCCNFFNGECIDEPTGGGDGNPTPPPPPPPVPQGCPSGYLPNGQGMCCRPGTNDCVSEGSRDGGNNGGGNNGGGTPTVDNNLPRGCPSGYLPNGQGMCCDPNTGICIAEGSVQRYTGYWTCPVGLLPTSEGNCLNPSTGQIIRPVFVFNQPDGEGGGGGGCELGKRQVIDENGEKVCIAGTLIDPHVVVRPDKPDPIIRDHPSAVSPRPYEPIVVSNGGGSGSGGGGGGNSGNDGRDRNDPGKKIRECQECKQDAERAYQSGVERADRNYKLKLAGIITVATGLGASTEVVLAWLNVTPPTLVIAQIISGAVTLGSGIGLAIYAMYDYYDDINQATSARSSAKIGCGDCP